MGGGGWVAEAGLQEPWEHGVWGSRSWVVHLLWVEMAVIPWKVEDLREGTKGQVQLLCRI